jgi:hypothetical protein
MRNSVSNNLFRTGVVAALGSTASNYCIHQPGRAAGGPDRAKSVAARPAGDACDAPTRAAVAAVQSGDPGRLHIP